MPPGAILLLLELVLPPPGQPSAEHLEDLTMIVVPGGQERTEQEYRLRLAESGSWLIEARPR